MWRIAQRQYALRMEEADQEQLVALTLITVSPELVLFLPREIFG